MNDAGPLGGKRYLYGWLLLLVIVLLGVWYLLTKNNDETQQEPMRRGWGNMATSVRVVPVESGSLKVQQQSIGTATALNTVIVRSRVGGVLTGLNFTEGAEVEAGEVLAQVDPAPFKAQLAQAEGQLQQNRAQLDNARVDLELYRGLYAEDSIAKQQLDSQAALVRQLEGATRSNQAAVDDARLQLEWSTVRAPIAGRLGLRRVDAGNLIAANDADGLVTITQTKPIAVFFTVPEVQVARLREAMRGNPALPVQVLNRDESRVIATGQLVTLDNQIDTNTGTLRVKAIFANEDEALFPNQFVNVRVSLAEIDNALTIPSDAVQHGSAGSYVYIVEDGKAYLRNIELGESDDERVAVLKGLNAGDQVVLEGLDRLRDGRGVIVEGEEAPASAPARTMNAERSERPMAAGQRPSRPEGGRPPSAPVH